MRADKGGGVPTQVKKSAIVVVINSLLIYDYVCSREGVNPDPYKVRISSIYMYTGTVFIGGIPVDLHTLAVIIVSKTKKSCN